MDHDKTFVSSYHLKRSCVLQQNQTANSLEQEELIHTTLTLLMGFLIRFKFLMLLSKISS